MFYGWRIVTATFVTNFIAVGLVFYSYGVFFRALIGAAFGRYRFGRMIGLMNPVMLPIRVLGIPYAGWIFDRTGSYQIAFLTFIGLCAVSILVLAFLRLPEVEPGTESTRATGASMLGS